jgi:hypothetical protein
VRTRKKQKDAAFLKGRVMTNPTAMPMQLPPPPLQKKKKKKKVRFYECFPFPMLPCCGGFAFLFCVFRVLCCVET